ncbi:hypothetical protein TNCV_3654651 [Trichonephila clavipes]|nr:hypothetical protein TNCV_3654651 [Trichonephila clavipes]
MAKRDGGQHEKEAQNWGGAGQQEEASQPGRDVGGAKHETGRNGQNDKRHGRERTEAGAAKEGNKESEQNKISMVHECMRNRLKLQEEGEGESWLRGFKRLRPLCRIVGKFVFAIGDSENCLCLN